MAGMEAWYAELRDIRNRLEGATLPGNTTLRTEQRMCIDQVRQVNEIRRERSTQIDRFNTMIRRLADLLLEQREVSLVAGVSESTLADTRSGSRWTAAVSELSGGKNAIDPDLRVFRERSIVAIGRLLAAQLPEKSPPAAMPAGAWPQGEWRTAAWFRSATSDLLLPDALRKAAERHSVERHRLRSKDDWRYQVESVISCWPEHRNDIKTRIKADASGLERTRADK